MTRLEELVAQYTAAAIRHKDGSRSGDYRKTNRAADTLARLVADIEKQGAVGKKAFAGLMGHRDVRVKSSAAYACLFIPAEQSKARVVLEEIALAEDMIGLNAEMVLKVWDDGELHDPWPSTQANCNCVACRQARGEALP